MRCTFALHLLVGLAVILAGCCVPIPMPTPTPTYTPDLGLHLLVEVKGDLTHKRPGWNEYLPLSFGTALDRDDLLKAAPDAEGLVVCADLSLAPVPAGYHGGLPCPQAEPVLTRGENLMVGPRRSAMMLSSIPYVLSPRHTFIQTPHPVLRWRPSGTGTVTYTVRVWGALDWQTETAATELRYPDSAPSLRPGVPYQLKVMDAAGRSSEEEGTALDLSFALLPSEETTVVQMLVAQVRELGLSERAIRLLEAEIYATQGLRADAIALLENLAAGEDAPAIHRRLGDLCLEVGLYTEARSAYEHALAGYRNLGDRAGEAATLVGLGLACWGNGGDDTAQDYMEQARAVYQKLGDAEGISWVERTLPAIRR